MRYETRSPFPSRSDPAVLRRPPRVVARVAVDAWRSSGAGVADAARLLPWALRHRRPLPPDVEAALSVLES